MAIRIFDATGEEIHLFEGNVSANRIDPYNVLLIKEAGTHKVVGEVFLAEGWAWIKEEESSIALENAAEKK